MKFKRKIVIIVITLFVVVTSAYVSKRIIYKYTCPRSNHADVSDKLCTKLFNDENYLHISAAKKVGLNCLPQDRSDLKNTTCKLTKVNSNKYYKIDKLTHSVPYLTHGGKELLDIIGKNFHTELEKRGIGPYKLIVTSILRTKEDVYNLQKVNQNASSNSAHCYATTFDITYIRFNKPNKILYREAFNKELKSILMDVLRKLQLEEKCYVKYEIKQKCFHITTRMK